MLNSLFWRLLSVTSPPPPAPANENSDGWFVGVSPGPPTEYGWELPWPAAEACYPSSVNVGVSADLIASPLSPDPSVSRRPYSSAAARVPLLNCFPPAPGICSRPSAPRGASTRLWTSAAGLPVPAFAPWDPRRCGGSLKLTIPGALMICTSYYCRRSFSIFVPSLPDTFFLFISLSRSPLDSFIDFSLFWPARAWFACDCAVFPAPYAYDSCDCVEFRFPVLISPAPSMPTATESPDVYPEDRP